MSAFFKNELGLILGILVANQFRGRIFKYRPPGENMDQVYIPEFQPPGGDLHYATGRGGYYKDFNGDAGKPGLYDSISQLPDKTLCGAGGELSRGGAGLYDGMFGIQKTFYINNSQVSAGPGSGWFGGGWSHVGGGAGGGSSFVLSRYGFDLLTNDLKYKIMSYYLSLLDPEIRETMTEEEAFEYVESFFGDWYDIKREAYGRYPWLYGLNTRERFILEQEGFPFMYDFRHKLNGNGAVLVSTVNNIITCDKVNGDTPTCKFNNVGTEFYFTGSTQELEIKEDGNYHIIAWGACGGDRWRRDFEGLGGFGGCASGIFHFKAGTKLLVNVGGRGERDIQNFLYASKGLGGCTGGGSASDVRYSMRHEESRIIVAAGGGGIYARTGDPEEPPDDVRQSKEETINPPRDEDGNYVEKDDEEARLPDMKFLVNDLSTVHVQIKCYNQLEIPDFALTSCSIYINDGLEGELHTTVKPEGGIYVHEFQFKLDKIYPPNTPTHEVTIEAIIKSNFYSILATDGIMVWVTTDFRLTDGTVPDNKIKISNHYDSLDFEDYYELERLTKRTITLELEEALGIEDFYELVKKVKGSSNVDLTDIFDINDFYELEKIRLSESKASDYSEEEIDDELVVSLVHLTYLYKDIEDILDFDDFIEIELIAGGEDPDKPIETNGHIGEFDALADNRRTIFRNQLIKYPVFNVSSIGYISENSIGSFDALANNTETELVNQT